MLYRLDKKFLGYYQLSIGKKLLCKYRLFDSEYYAETYPDLKDYPHNLIHHFLNYGWKEYRNPCKEFDTTYYFNNNQDVRKSGTMPVLHYIKYGYREGRRPAKDADIFLEWSRFHQNEHTFKKFIYEYKSMYRIYKSGMFSGEYYLHEYPEVAEQLSNTFGWKLRDSNIGFVRILGKFLSTPIRHYVKKGMYEGFNPNSTFDTRIYLENYTDLRAAKYMNLFEHYCYYGKSEGRVCRPVNNDESIYLRNYIDKQEKKGEPYTISVILPHSENSKGLQQRVECILKQSIQPKECIILHCSDQERKDIEKRCRNAAFGLIFHNEKGSDGLKCATGNLIWILEDGYHANNTFLEVMNTRMQNKAILMADCYFNDSLAKLNIPYKFDKNGVCITLGKREFDITNCAPYYRLSRMLFRNPKEFGILGQKDRNLLDPYGIQRFVLHYLTKGGFLHTNQKLVSCIKYNSVNEVNLDERYLFLRDLYRTFHVDPKEIKNQYENMRTEYLSRKDSDPFYWINHFPIQNIFETEYQPNVLIGIYAFVHGGGEIMPIRLANELYAKGIQVYVHAKNHKVYEEKVRNMLHPDIPVYYSESVKEMADIIKYCGIEVVNTHHQGLQSFYGMGDECFQEQGVKIYHVGTSHGLYDQFEDSTLNYIFNRQLKGKVNYWTYVADKNLIPFQKHGQYNPEQFQKIPNGMSRPIINEIHRSDLGIPEDAFVFALASRAIPPKGWYDAIECTKMIQNKTNKEVHLLLIGEGPVYDELKERQLPDYIHCIGFRDNSCEYYAISDAVILLSTYKSESAPLTLIEAMMVGKPMIASDIGDIRQMMTYKEMIAGDVFQLVNGKIPHQQVVEIMTKLITDEDYYKQCCAVSTAKSREFELSHIADQYLEIYKKSESESSTAIAVQCREEIRKSNQLLALANKKEQTLKVSVIVPNYNHSKFLRQRLDCIYQQTYKNIEVILMDDCSKDNSREILEEYRNSYPEITKYVPNEVNSGGVFYQWCKGIKLAAGEICWIAESDDFCDKNFIEKLIPAFEDPEVKISYCHYQFVNQEGNPKEFTFESYVGSVSKTKWSKNYVNDSEQEVKEAMALINSIPNASGALFRKPGELEIFKEKRWLSMKICGDWIFYLYLMHGGKVAYSVDTNSYFRFHDSNSSAKTYTKPEYYLEHSYVAETLRVLYGTEDAILEKMCEKIERFYGQNVKDVNMKFRELFNLKEILSQKKKKEVKAADANVRVSVRKYPGEKEIKTLIINPIKSGGTNLNSNVAEKVLYYGNNVGNMLFVEAMKEQAIYVDDIFQTPQTDDSLDQYAKVMPSSNFIIRGKAPFIDNLHAFMNSVKGPFTLAGLGAQSNSKTDTPGKLVSELDPSKVRFFKALSERAVSIGVRGEFTAACLEKMGIYNYRIIGCPSAFMFFDGKFKMTKQPDPSRSVFNVTTKNPMESKIIDLGMQHNDQWIMQMMTEYPETALENKEMTEEEYLRAFPNIKASKEELTKFMKTNAHMFFSYEEWCDFLKTREISFSYGSRFHGNMCSLRNGVPALWITHDSRTSELVNTLHLPSIDYEKFQQIKYVEELAEYCNYDDFNKNFYQLTKNYVEFLDENQISHKFVLQ